MEAINFITEWVTWLLLIIPVGAGTMITYQAARKVLTNDESIISECNTKIRNTLKGAIIGVSISGVITLIKSFFM